MKIPTVLVVLATPAVAQVTNLAPSGVATQSTTGYGGVPGRAIDGDTDGAWGNSSVTHSTDQPNSWWEVDLGSVQAVHEIRIHNRSDCCAGRLSNFRTSLFLGGAEVFGQSSHTGSGSVPAGQAEVIPVPAGLFGDRVRVELLGLNNDGNGVLSLAEVEVLQFGTAPSVNVAVLGTATQSTMQSGGTPERAIDGNTDGWWGNNSVTHTADVAGSWWEVDLGWRFELDEIVLHNRSDCCAERLSNFRVSVHDGPVEVFGQDFFPISDAIVYAPAPSMGPTSPAGISWSAHKPLFPISTGSVAPGAAHSVPLPAGTTGDRVRVELLGVNAGGTWQLSLAEVEVLSASPTLSSDTLEISAAAGGTQALSLEAGSGAGGLPYLVLGTFSGTAPGFAVDGATVLPLNPDAYWVQTLTNPNAPPLSGSLGVLDAVGRAQASLQVPPIASLQGLTAHHAFLALNAFPALPAVPAVSNPVPVAFVP